MKTTAAILAAPPNLVKELLEKVIEGLTCEEVGELLGIRIFTNPMLPTGTAVLTNGAGRIVQVINLQVDSQETGE